MGLMSSLFGSKNKTKSSSQVDPWDETTKYLLGDKDNKGVFPSAQGQFATGGFTQPMQDANAAYLNQIQARGNGAPNSNYQGNIDPGVNNFLNQAASDLGGAAYDVGRGAFDSNFQGVGNTNFQGVHTPQTNMVDARAGQGRLDPTQPLARMMSGRPDNPYLDSQARAITGQLTRNMQQNILPGIRSEALASGQYGGSRQGIAEGNAISNLNQDLAPALTNLYGGAYENAQNRMYGTATQLNDQAFQNVTNNANRNLQGQEFNSTGNTNTQQFNANLGLQNNQQQMAKNQSNLGNRMQALDIANGGLGLLSGGQQLRAGDQQLALTGAQGSQQLQAGQNSLQDNNFAQQMAALGMPQDVNWQNLNNYANLMYQGAGLGNQSSGKNTQTSQPGIVPAVLGTLTGIGGLASGFKGLGGGMMGGAATGGSGMGGFSNAARGFMSGAPSMFG